MNRTGTAWQAEIIRELKAEIATLREREARLRAVVEEVEWVGEEPSWMSCPWCYCSRSAGHAVNCKRQEVLDALKGGE